VDGRKTFTTGSAILQFFLVSCGIEDDASPEAELEPLTVDRGYFLVPRSTPGLRIYKTWNTMGMRTSASDDLVLENVHLDASAYIGNWESYHQAAWGLPVCALYLGIGQAARDEAVQFAKRRRPNSLNQSIASIPHIQEKVAKMDLALLQARTVLFDTAAQFSTDPSSVSAGQLAAAKYLATNHAVEVVELAMRLVGGASLSLNFPLQRHYRDVRAGLQHPPMDDVTLALLAKEALEG
jgi:alkylation response protein AidB-like acyl-CoA dehydrogenase